MLIVCVLIVVRIFWARDALRDASLHGVVLVVFCSGRASPGVSLGVVLQMRSCMLVRRRVSTMRRHACRKAVFAARSAAKSI